MTVWHLAPGEERPVPPRHRRRVGSLTPAEIADRCEQLGARVERSGHHYRVYPPDPDRRPVFVPDRLGGGRDSLNLVAQLRRAGLDVAIDPQEIPDMPTPTDLAPRNGAPRPAPASPAVDGLRQQVQTMLEMLAEADTRVGQLVARVDELESRLAATPGAPPAKDPHADLDDAIVALLGSTPIKLTADVVAANLPEETAMDLVAERLQRLADAGRVTQESVAGCRAYRAAR